MQRYRIQISVENNITITRVRLRQTSGGAFWQQQTNVDVNNVLFSQDGATSHTASPDYRIESRKILLEGSEW